MNDRISWDPSLVKKFGSSNHYKLLNQLRSEVKKYPLYNKNKSSSISNKDIELDTNKKSNISHIKNKTSTISSNSSNENYINNSTVSFNNAKNFSIYNQKNNNKIDSQNEINLSDQSNTKEGSSYQSFNDRLNQIDMK
tara:strand:+ start:102 stop:515 length:414 start_codon:yes stop_codon:yes gene_type:complete